MPQPDLEAFNLSSPEPPPQDDRGLLVTEAVSCRQCGRTLRGRRSRETCTCGTRVAWSLWRDDAPADHHAPIARSLLCRRCGYELRGLRLDGRCPECGMSALRSSLGDMLLAADPAYIATLHRGAIVVEVAFLAAIAMWFINLLSGFAGASGYVFGVLRTFDLGVEVASLVGWWLLSSPDPVAQAHEPTRNARRTVRVAVVVLTAVALLGVASLFFGLNMTATGATLGLAGIAGLAWLVAWIVKLFASIQYLKVLAPRVPDPTLEARAQTARQWVVATVITFLGVVLLTLLLAPLGMLLGLVGLVVALIAALHYLLLLDRARVALGGARAHVEAG